MRQMHAEAGALIPARPEEVYAILRDYHQHHPRILPKDYFPKLELEQGGTGAGTVFRVWTRALGIEQSFHMDVSEPEPGRVLVETDRATGLRTTFTVEPTEQAQQAHVTIATDWQAQPGIAGLFEKLLTPLLMRRIYRKELQQLADYARSKPVAPGGQSWREG
jgi:hypothetical protein